MELRKGILKRPHKIVLYGVEGVGKTTFAAGAPDPVFLDIEQGSELLDVSRFDVPTTWSEVLEAVSYLWSNPDACKTFVLDSISAAERLASAHVAGMANAKSIEDIGYGKGYGLLAEEIGSLLVGLDSLVAKGMNVIVIGHSVVQRFDDPAGEAFDRYDLALSKKVAPLVKQWGDTVLFADHDKSVVDSGEGFSKRKIAKSYGSRIMFTEHRASHTAKNRFRLPERLPLSWSDFETGVNNFYGTTE